MVDFRFFLNKQGPKGAKGDPGEQGFSPEITVDTDTAAEYKLRITTASDSFVTENLRGSAVDDQGGTYMRYDPETQGMYAGDADVADTTTYGVVKTASDEDISTGASDKVVSAEQLKEAIDEVTSTSTTTYATKEELAAESSTRESTDTSLDNRLTVVEGSIPDVSGFATKASLSTEISDRTTADANLAGLISTETTNRTNADTSLQESISTLASQIPTVNNGTLTIKQNGTTLTTFSANQSSDTEVDITGGGAVANNGKLTIQQNGVDVGEFTADQSSNTTLNITTPTVNDTAITFNYGTTPIGSITLNQSSTETITIPESSGGGSTPITTTLSSSSTNSEVPGAKCVYDEFQEIPEYTFSTGLTETTSLTEIDVTPRTTETPTGNYTVGTTVITSERSSTGNNYLRYAFDGNTSTQFVQPYPNPDVYIQDSQGYDFDIVKIMPGSGSVGANFASFTISYLSSDWVTIATTSTLVDGWAIISGIGDTIRSLPANTSLKFHIDMVDTTQWGGYKEIQLYKLQGSNREKIVSADMATNTTPGIVQPDNETVRIISKNHAFSYQATQFGQYLQTASAIPFNTANSWQIDLDILYKQEYNTDRPNHCILGTSSGSTTDVFNFYKESAGLVWYITSGSSVNDIGAISGIDPVDNTRYIFRLQYKNNVYSAYYSTDGGTTFTQMGNSITSSTKVASSVPLRFFETGFNADRYATKGTIFCEKSKIYINDEVYLDFTNAQTKGLLTNSGCTKVDTDPVSVLSVTEESVQSFANKDLSNVTDAADILMAHNAMPSNTYIDLTPGADGARYTAPADGYFVGVSTEATGECWFALWNITTGLGSYVQAPAVWDLLRVSVPVKKNDIVQLDYGAISIRTIRFIYAVGSESEAS